MKKLIIPAIIILIYHGSAVMAKDRARDLGIPFNGTPGKYNAITDVKGVLVGHSTVISGKGKLIQGKGPIRTGVTAILPRGDKSLDDPSFAGYNLGGRIWISRGANHDNKYPQCGNRPRCGNFLAS